MDCSAAINLELEEKIKKLGDLPLFSATINRIQKIGSDPDSNAAALSTEITKDIGLTTALLRLANSSYYRRGSSKVAVISRSIVLLGFDTIINQALTMKLIDSFQGQHPSNKISNLLVTAYQAASLARDIAMRTGLRNVEEVYTCTLLHGIGTIAVAYFLPEKYQQHQDKLHQGNVPAQQIEQDIFGITIEKIGQCLARSWEFPDTIVLTMNHFDIKNDDRPRGALQINRALSSLSSDLVAKLHNADSNPMSFSEIITGLVRTIGLDHKIIENCLVDSYRSSTELASIYGLKADVLSPNLAPSDDPVRDRLAGQLAYLSSNIKKPQNNSTSAASNHEKIDIVNTGASNTTEQYIQNKDNKKAVIEMERLFQYIQEITALTYSNSSLNIIFSKIIEAIQECVGFDRTALCLISPDQKSYSARLVYGDDTDCLKDYFNLKIDPASDIFSKVLTEGNEVIVNDSRDTGWHKILKNKFYQSTGGQSFIISGLLNKSKPVGFIYADNKHSIISYEQKRYYLQFISQARLALKMSAG